MIGLTERHLPWQHGLHCWTRTELIGNRGEAFGQTLWPSSVAGRQCKPCCLGKCCSVSPIYLLSYTFPGFPHYVTWVMSWRKPGKVNNTPTINDRGDRSSTYLGSRCVSPGKVSEILGLPYKAFFWESPRFISDLSNLIYSQYSTRFSKWIVVIFNIKMLCVLKTTWPKWKLLWRS